ncbi:MAG: glycoside hydrolase family 16 protein [Bacteroidota bacterium]
MWSSRLRLATVLHAGQLLGLPLLCLVLLSGAGCSSDDGAGVDEAPGLAIGDIAEINGQSWELVWHDEFEEDGYPDPARWDYDVGGHGWGNQELQTYKARDFSTARVQDGNLIITASQGQPGDGNAYRSARLVTRGKADWLYGRIEARAILPGGRGTWPAIWMLPTDNAYGGWPRSGEIDIMEHVGFDPTVVHATVHTEAYNHMQGTQRGNKIDVPDALTDYHLYAIEWDEDRIDFYMDGQRYFTFGKEDGGSAVWPFDQRFHLIMNIAVGGTWGGQQGVDAEAFPQEMQVDYVRVYRTAP